MVTARSVRRTTDCLTTVSMDVLRLVLGVTGAISVLATAADTLVDFPEVSGEDGTGRGGAARNDLSNKIE